VFKIYGIFDLFTTIHHFKHFVGRDAFHARFEASSAENSEFFTVYIQQLERMQNGHVKRRK